MRVAVFEQLHSEREQKRQDLTRWLQQQQQQQQQKQQTQTKPGFQFSQFSGKTPCLQELSKLIKDQSKYLSEKKDFCRPTNVQAGLAQSFKPIGSPSVEAPLSTAKPFDNDLSRALVGNDAPIGLPRSTTALLCSLDIVKRVNAVERPQSSTAGEWKRIDVGVDSCAGVSVTPPGVFPGSVEVTDRVGEEYTSASDHILYNLGQQTVDAYTDEYVPVNACFQVAEVNKPLMSVSSAYENGNTVLYSKKHGSWVINDETNIATPMEYKNNTFSMGLWVFTRPE